MGYDLHITRKEHWADENDEPSDISFQEWLDYIEKDKDMKLSDESFLILKETTYFDGEWLTHPLGEIICFSYGERDIFIKNPDEHTIKKMLDIACALNAKVQGDEGEIYKVDSEGDIGTYFPNHNQAIQIQHNKRKHAWWKLW